MKQKDSFIMYLEWLESFLVLPENELRMILTALRNYVKNGMEPEFIGTMKAYWIPIQNRLDRAQQKYDATCQKRAEAGRQGGLKRQANQAFASNCKQTVANQADHEHDHDNELSNDNKKKIQKEKEKNFSFVAVDFIPEELKTPEFIASWGDWENYRKERRKALTPSSAKRQLKMLAEHSASEAIAMIERSIRNGWTGLFPGDKPKSPEPTNSIDAEIARLEELCK